MAALGSADTQRACLQTNDHERESLGLQGERGVEDDPAGMLLAARLSS